MAITVTDYSLHGQGLHGGGHYVKDVDAHNSFFAGPSPVH